MSEKNQRKVILVTVFAAVVLGMVSILSTAFGATKAELDAEVAALTARIVALEARKNCTDVEVGRPGSEKRQRYSPQRSSKRTEEGNP